MSLGQSQYYIESSPVCQAVTPSDTVNFSVTALGQTFLLTRALYVGTTGNVVIVNEEGTTCTFNTVPAGAILPVVCKRVNSTNTTASNIVALF